MPNLKINVRRNGNTIDLSPAALPVPYQGSEPQTITWVPGPGIEITAIDLKDPEAPITQPEKQNDGTWTAKDTNDNTGTDPNRYGYSITIDPEIVNEPQGGAGGSTGNGG